MERKNTLEIPAVSVADSLPKISLRLAYTAIVIGLLVLLGWGTHTEILKSILPGLTTMKVNTALTTILLGIGVVFLNSPKTFAKTIVIVSVSAPLLIATATECEYLLRVDLHIDNLFIKDVGRTIFPGRMAPTTICSFVFLGIGVLMLQLRWWLVAAQLILCVTIGVSLTTLGGYLYGAPTMLVSAPYPVVAVHTAVAVILLGLAALLKRPNEGPTSIVIADTTGGWVARRLIPTAMVVPLTIGLCVVAGQRAGVYGVAFAIALTVSADVTVMTATIWWVSALLNKADADRQHTEREIAQAETRLRELSNAMPQIVWTAGPDGVIDYYNDRWYEFTGFERGPIGDKSWDPILHPDDVTRCYTVYHAAIRSGTPYQIDLRFKDRQTGGYRWFLTRALPSRDDTGKIIRWNGTSTDIDEQKSAIEERRQLLEAERAARGEAERQSVLKDNFLATLSHELRTPLNAILGWASLLAIKTDLSQEMRDGLEVIERNSRAQAQIVGDLLDMSRIVSGKLRLEVETVDIAKIIELALQTARPSADAKQVTLDVTIDPDSTVVMGDPNRMLQITWNLLSNALKFTPAGGWVRVKLTRVGSQMHLIVQDNGKGISANFLPQLFGRFRQEDSGAARRFGGLGLGLSIVRQLVELHGGTVTAESPGDNHGSTFTAMFPLITERSQVRSTAASPTATIAGEKFKCEPFNVKGVRVLVVDDEPDSASLIRRMLEECHATVVTAGSADEAIERLSAESFDVLLSDIGMPDRTGYDLIRQIRQTKPDRGNDIPAAAVTAYVRPEDRVRVLQAGFQMHLHKPVEASELIATVASLAGRNR